MPYLFDYLASGFNKLADSYYAPIAGYYDATQVQSPSYSPVNFRNDRFAPENPDFVPQNMYIESESRKDPITKPPTAFAVSRTVAQPQTIDYLNAELAKHYGMSAETAYQEALANTSYQRAMKDMQAAGLNPAVLFGAGKGAGADGVSYVSSGTTGSGPSGGTSAKSNKKNNLFSEGAYYGLSAAIGLVGALLMKSPTGYWIGQSVAQGAMGAANAGYKSR